MKNLAQIKENNLTPAGFKEYFDNEIEAPSGFKRLSFRALNYIIDNYNIPFEMSDECAEALAYGVFEQIHFLSIKEGLQKEAKKITSIKLDDASESYSDNEYYLLNDEPSALEEVLSLSGCNFLYVGLGSSCSCRCWK